MRLILVTTGSLIVCFIIFWTIKFWGRSQIYANYQHPLFAYSKVIQGPVFFEKPAPEMVEKLLDTESNLYLDTATTEDGKLVVAKKKWDSKMKPIRYSNYENIKSDVILLIDVKEKLKKRKLIFNISENAQAGHIIFIEELKKMGLDKGENLIVTSPYEAMAKALKEEAPALLFASTQPEILKITAMKSMHLIEALQLRADIVIHPIFIKNETFFDSELMNEIKRRHKRFIVGPVSSAAEIESAKALNPWGVLVSR